MRDLFRLQLDARAQRLQHVGAARLRRHAAVAVLGHARAGRGDHEHRGGGDVERVRAVAAGADDVDQVGCGRRRDRRANSRSTAAAPAISPTVSFLTRRPVRIAAVIVGETSPRMTCRIRSTISSWKISRCSMVRCRASCG
jgi:hypothetical protein